jgi:hypothetical protein
MVALMQAGAQAPSYLEQKSLEPQVAQVLPPVLMLEQVLQVALQAQTQGQQVPASRSVLAPQAQLVSLQAVQPQVPGLPQAPQQQAQVSQVLVQQRAVQPVPLRVQQQLVRAQVLQVLVRVLELARAPPFVQL